MRVIPNELFVGCIRHQNSSPKKFIYKYLKNQKTNLIKISRM